LEILGPLPAAAFLASRAALDAETIAAICV
jgi:hypothetical protein